MEGGTANEENCATSNSPSDFDYPQPRVPDFERIQNARNRRKLQIKEWQQYDRKMMRESEKLQRKGLSPPAERGFFRGKQSVKFPQSLIFLEAAARGDLEEVRKLLSEGVCPNVANENGLTALHQCCIDNTREMCLLLLRFGADPNARDTEQWTPLHAAATCNHTDLCGILIAHNADLLAMNADGNMPYECCMPGPTLNLIETEMDKKGITQEQLDDLHRLPECQMLNDMVTLCKSGADLNALDSQGASWLHIAAASGFEDVTLFLIKNGAKVDLTDKDGWQAIHIAACWDHLEIIEILVNCGANIMAETTSGETVFDICEDLEMHARLNEIKEEMERRKTRQSTPSHSDRPRESVRRRSGTNPRSASIRRTSMREKKLISWKEAKQEAEMRGTSQLDVAESEPPMGADKLPIKPTEPSHDRRVTSPLAVGSPDIKQPPGQQHQLTPSISGPEHINRTPSPAVDRGSQNDDPGWSPRLRMSHPSTSANGLIRPSNGTTSAVRNLTRPVDGNNNDHLTNTVLQGMNDHAEAELTVNSDSADSSLISYDLSDEEHSDHAITKVEHFEGTSSLEVEGEKQPEELNALRVQADNKATEQDTSIIDKIRSTDCFMRTEFHDDINPAVPKRQSTKRKSDFPKSFQAGRTVSPTKTNGDSLHQSNRRKHPPTPLPRQQSERSRNLSDFKPANPQREVKSVYAAKTDIEHVSPKQAEKKKVGRVEDKRVHRTKSAVSESRQKLPEKEVLKTFTRTWSTPSRLRSRNERSADRNVKTPISPSRLSNNQQQQQPQFPSILRPTRKSHLSPHDGGQEDPSLQNLQTNNKTDRESKQRAKSGTVQARKRQIWRPVPTDAVDGKKSLCCCS